MAGVGYLRLVDRVGERVELSNLNRQILYKDTDVGRVKVKAAEEAVRGFNSGVVVEGVEETIDQDNIMHLISGMDFVVDGLDSVRDRLLVNDACVKLGIPANHAFVHGFRGELVNVLPREGPCLRCILRDEDAGPSLTGVGVVIGVSAGVVGLAQACDAIKYLIGLGDFIVGRRILFDLTDWTIYQVDFTRDRNCPVCSAKESMA